jgi:hypothetical protein
LHLPLQYFASLYHLYRRNINSQNSLIVYFAYEKYLLILTIKDISFIAAPGTAALSNRNPASAGRSRDSFDAQDSGRRNFCSRSEAVKISPLPFKRIRSGRHRNRMSGCREERITVLFSRYTLQ